MPKGKPKGKYNWNKIKAEFMASDFVEVKAFFESRFGHYDGNMSKRSRGWSPEKIARDKRIAEQSLAKAEQAEINSNAIALKNILTGFKLHLSTEGEIKKLTMKDKKIIWDVFRTELGLPTRVVFQKNENVNCDAGKARQGILDRLKDKKKTNDRPKKSTTGG